MVTPRSMIKASGVNPFDRSYHCLQHQFDHQIINILSEMLKLNITLVQTPLITNLMTYLKNPDSWILEQIVNGTAEISSTTVILTPESPNSVEYSHGIGTFRPQLYFKAKSLRENSNIYLIPFSSELWISLIAAVILLTITLIFILSIESKLPHEISYDVFARIIDIQEDKEEGWTDYQQNTLEESVFQKAKWEMGEILLICLGALCQQGSARDPSTNAARLLLLVLFVLAVVGYTAYSASIISLISLFPSTEHEETCNLEHFSVQYNTLLHNTPKSEHYLQLGFKNIEFINPEKGFAKIILGDSIYVGDRDISHTVLHQQNYKSNLRCSLGRAFIGKEYQRVFSLKNNSLYTEKINHNILRLKQSGLIERERRKVFNIRPLCSLVERTSQSNFVSFDTKDVKPVMNLFLLGLLTSVIFLLAENLIYYCGK